MRRFIVSRASWDHCTRIARPPISSRRWNLDGRSQVGVGRALRKGGAFVAFADDASALFGMRGRCAIDHNKSIYRSTTRAAAELRSTRSATSPSQPHPGAIGFRPGR